MFMRNTIDFTSRSWLGVLPCYWDQSVLPFAGPEVQMIVRTNMHLAIAYVDD